MYTCALKAHQQTCLSPGILKAICHESLLTVHKYRQPAENNYRK